MNSIVSMNRAILYYFLDDSLFVMFPDKPIQILLGYIVNCGQYDFSLRPFSTLEVFSVENLWKSILDKEKEFNHSYLAD